VKSTSHLRKETARAKWIIASLVSGVKEQGNDSETCFKHMKLDSEFMLRKEKVN
jgi:hypothetical protein